MKLLYSIALLGIALFANAQTQYPNSIDGQVYLKIKNQYPVGEFAGRKVDITTVKQVKGLVETYGITTVLRPFYLKQAPHLGQVYKVYFTEYAKVDELIAQLQKDSMVEYAERVPRIEHQYTPNDLGFQSYANGNWGLYKVKAPQAWDVTTGSASIKIAIVDDAVDITHADLQGNIWNNPNEIPSNSIDDDNNGYVDDVTGYDVGDDDTNVNPDDTSQWHGTFCAGIASADTDNGTGMAGIGFNCKIIPVKMAQAADPNNPNGYEGVVYAVAAGADVINLSWGGFDSSLTEQTIVTTAYNLGAIICAAAGNQNGEAPLYPAAYNNVLAVAATGNNGPTDAKSAFSNYGTWVDVCAPGDNIKSTYPGNLYQTKDGTSMAAPLVAGLAGLILSVDSTLSPAEVVSCIKTTADNIDADNPTYVGKLGTGRINALAAVQCVATGLGEEAAEGFSLYPNPANSIVYIAFNKPDINTTVMVVNGLGQIVYTHSSTINPIAIPVENLPVGIYNVRIAAGKKIMVKKLVVE